MRDRLADEETMNSSAADAAAALFGMAMLLPILMLGVLLLAVSFWIWMIVDSATNPGLTGNDKLMWVLIVVFTNWIGALIYFFVARPRRQLVAPSLPARPPAASRVPPLPPPPLAAPVPSSTLESEQITCSHCGSASPFFAYRTQTDGRGHCPNCGISVVFE